MNLSTNSPHVLPPAFYLLCLLLVIGAGGCEPAAEPEYKQVERDLSGLDNEAFVQALKKDAASPEVSSAEPSRLLAAMIDRPEATYFLKSMGTATEMESVVEPFQQIVQSLDFEGQKPISWDVPTGWEETPGGAAFRLATITGPEGQLIAVTSLTPGQDLLLNVNRWQGQIGLPNLTEDQLDVDRITVQGQEVILYDQQGQGTSNSMSSAPFASPNTTPSVPNTAAPATTSEPGGPATQQLPFTLPERPEGWSELPASGSKLVRWSKPTDSETLYFELLKFPAGPEFSMMLNVWAPTVGSSEVAADQFTQMVQEVPIGSRQGQWFGLPANDEMRLPDSESSNLSMRVARLVLGQDAWYFKWYGPSQDVEKQEEEFQQFLKQVSVE